MSMYPNRSGAGVAGYGRRMATDDLRSVTAPMPGTVVFVAVEIGQAVRVGTQLVILESMKMEHPITADAAGIVESIAVEQGAAVTADQVLLTVRAGLVVEEAAVAVAAVDPDHIRPDLAEVIARHEVGLDASRPDAVARRRSTNHRTTRENVADLVDDGTFVEYGAIAIAAQRRRRSLEDLIARTPADGMIGGIGTVNGDRFSGRSAQTIVMSYDYTVLAGTQGTQNHRKKDRLFEVAEKTRLPVVFFTEGGGGRPGDTDSLGVSGLDCLAFMYFGRLSGLVPLVGITTGYCFAGNAALLGCCDVVIATEGSNIGMGGPAMIEGGGLGIFDPKDVGPLAVQQASGVIDIVVADEAEAVAVAKQYLSYFQGSLTDWSAPDQRLLRHVIPENRLRTYDTRAVFELLFDTDSVLEIRAGFGLGMVTAFARIEGRPVGVIANNPNHLAGAIDSDGADKAARFMQLCDAFAIPIITLIDTPGMMVGPEVEATGLVRHCSRLFVTGANLSVPLVSVVLRKCYGLGAQAMAGGSLKAPLACVAWPSGEFGGMGLEGAVRLGYRKELEAITDPLEQQATFDQMVARMYEHGKALSVATYFEIDDVIDPADTRRWLATVLAAAPTPHWQDTSARRRPNVDTW